MSLTRSDESLLTTSGRALGELEAAERLLATDPSQAITLARLAAEEAMREGEQLLLARAHLVYGTALRRLGDLVSAQQMLNDAEALFTDLGDTFYLARLWQARAAIYNAAGELDEAIACLERAMPVAQANGDTRTYQRILSTWAVAAMRKGEYTQAIALLEQALESLVEHPDDGLRVVVLNAYGSIYQRSRNYQVALEYFERSLGISRTNRRNGSKESRNHSASLICIADTLITLGRFADAAPYLDEALDLAREHELLDVHASVLKAYGDRAMGEQQFALAIKHYDEACDMVEATGNGMILITVLNQLGDASIRAGKLESAEQALQRALDLERSSPSPEHEFATHRLMAELFEMKEDYRSACVHYSAALASNQRLFSEANQRVLRENV
jgi:tetratricopeptide (TPR) repeat protein